MGSLLSLAAGRRRDGRAQGVAMRLGDAVGDQPPSARAVLQGARQQLGEGRVGALDRAVAVDRGDGHGRGIEESRKPHLGRAGFLGGLLARRAVERQRARGAGKAVMAIGDAMQQAHRQSQSVAAAQVEVDLLGAHGGGRPLAGVEQAAASLATISRRARPPEPTWARSKSSQPARVAFM